MRLFDRPASHRASRPTIVIAAAAAVIVMGILTYLAAVAPRGVPAVDYYMLKAQFRDSADLRNLSAVSIAGRRAGQVSSIRNVGDQVELELQLKPGTQKLRSDTTARIRLKNPVGAKLVSITPGSSGRELASGDTIPLAQTSTSVDTQELLSDLDAPTRKNLQRTVSGLGKGFLGRGQDINEMLPKAPPLASDLRQLSDAVLARHGAAERFAPSAASLAKAYDPVRSEAAGGLPAQAQVLETLADRRSVLQTIVDLAPPALTALRSGLAETDPLLVETRGFARSVTALTKPAPAALREATVLLRDARPALKDSRPLLDSARRAVPPTVDLLDGLDPVIEPTERVMDSSRGILSDLGGSRACDFISWGEDWRSALSWGVPTGHDPTSNLDASQGMGPNNNSFRVLALNPTSETLLPDGKATANVGRDAYPAPCTANNQRYP